MVTAIRLPGIQFEVIAPPVNETLVRMDIAVFVGFAASGPLHLPVMVEDIVRFEEIFGNDLVLASVSDSNEPVYAYLPSTVRAFFRNGGRRCWARSPSRACSRPCWCRSKSGGACRLTTIWRRRSTRWSPARARMAAGP